MSQLLCLAAFCIFSEVAAVDGDTFDAGPWAQRFRLWGVDTPERGEPGYAEATEALSRLTAGGIVCRRAQGAMTFGRLVVQCWDGAGRDVGCELLRQGHAVEVLRYSGGAYATCRSEGQN